MQTEACGVEDTQLVKDISQKIENMFVRVKSLQEKYEDFYTVDLDLVEDYCECANVFEKYKENALLAEKEQRLLAVEDFVLADYSKQAERSLNAFHSVEEITKLQLLIETIEKVMKDSSCVKENEKMMAFLEEQVEKLKALHMQYDEQNQYSDTQAAFPTD